MKRGNSATIKNGGEVNYLLHTHTHISDHYHVLNDNDFDDDCVIFCSINVTKCCFGG